jgi:hypothetical protein
MLKLKIWKFLGGAIFAATVLMLTAPAGSAQNATRGAKNGTWGPSTCVHVRSQRSRQTRYAGAPRCRRIPA